VPDGQSWRALILAGRADSLPVLRKIRDLLQAGATGDRPPSSGSCQSADDPGEFRAPIAAIWETVALAISAHLHEGEMAPPALRASD
jgi:hypothetical protein